MVIVLLDHVALTPAGRPFAPATPSFDIPVAPVVVCVIVGESATLIQDEAVVPEEAVFKGVIITVAVEFVQLPPPGTVYV